jgi:hypothetical protein
MRKGLIIIIILAATAALSFPGPAGLEFTCLNGDDIICLYYQYCCVFFDQAVQGVVPYFDREFIIDSLSDKLNGMYILNSIVNESELPHDSVWWSFKFSDSADVHLGFINDSFANQTTISWLAEWENVDMGYLAFAGPYLGNTYSYSMTTWYRKSDTIFHLQGMASPDMDIYPNFLVLLTKTNMAGRVNEFDFQKKGESGLIEVYPNPFSTSVSIKAMSNEQRAMSVEIFDLVGRVVRATSDVRRATYMWDGRDDRGQLVPDGVYVVRLKAGNQLVKKKVILTR